MCASHSSFAIDLTPVQLCQDLEEERMDFLRISLWDYTNALSAICVADDEVGTTPEWDELY
jgi:hypothetical protein